MLDKLRLKLDELKPKFKLAGKTFTIYLSALTALAGFKLSGLALLALAAYLNYEELKQAIVDLKK